MLYERRHHIGTEAAHDVHDAVRKARLAEQVHHRDDRRRRVLRGLHDDRVAGGQRRRHLPRRQPQRRVPREDGGHHAVRLVQRVVQGVGAVDRDDVALDLVGQAAVVVVPAGHRPQRRAQLDVGLAVVAALGRHQFVEVVQHEVTESMQEPAPGGRGQVRPWPVREGGVRSGDGPLDVAGVAQSDLGPRLTGEGVDGLEPPAADGRHLLATDVHPDLPTHGPTMGRTAISGGFRSSVAIEPRRAGAYGRREVESISAPRRRPSLRCSW